MLAVRVEGMNHVNRIDSLARAFLASALAVLRREHVVPTPPYHPYLQVGRDYFGDSVMRTREFAELERAVAERHPRFSDATPLMERDFANGYIFSFLEAFVAEATLRGEDLSPSAPAFGKCLDSLMAATHDEDSEVACCREVSNLTTTGGEILEFEDVTVVPLTAPPHDHTREADRIIDRVIPHAQSAFGRDSAGSWDPPHSIVIAQRSSSAPFQMAKALTGRIERFLLAVRLLHAGTCGSLYEVQGGTTLVRRFRPMLMNFRGSAGSISEASMLSRTAHLAPRDVVRFAGLAEAIASVDGAPQHMLVSPFGVAKHRFLMSYHAHAWHEQIIDLAISLEAALSGTAKRSVIERLKVRGAALLATGNDPADDIRRDIGILYKLRSWLVHGNALDQDSFSEFIKSISAVPNESLPGEAIDHAVDRLRDLVRRALLARIFLATGDPPLWKLEHDEGTGACLDDPDIADSWRSSWHNALEDLDALAAVDRPQVAVRFPSSENE